ncbi:ATP-binding protein [Jatrophihabitans sp. DSM 45814]
MATLWVRHAPASASIVRRSVSAALRESGVSENDAYDAALIASELVGNAVRHAPALPSGHLVIDWTIAADSYTIAVTDGGGIRELTIPETNVWETSGRGLSIIAAISTAWGVTPGESSTTVWARGEYTSEPRADNDQADLIEQTA